VLVCPKCQADRDDWQERLERCARCGSTRLSLMLDEVVCRQCGLVGSETGA
jgi:rubredoxin